MNPNCYAENQSVTRPHLIHAVAIKREAHSKDLFGDNKLKFIDHMTAHVIDVILNSENKKYI